MYLAEGYPVKPRPPPNIKDRKTRILDPTDNHMRGFNMSLTKLFPLCILDK